MKQRAEQELADASIPAFTEEINSIHNLLSYFDPSYVKPATNKNASTTGSNGASIPSTTKNQARVIEFPEDLVVVKKEQDDFFTGTKKKGKGGKKQGGKKNFTVAPEIVVALSDLTIPFPLKEDDVPETIKTLKETLEALQQKQEEQTKINIERAKAKIAKFKEEDFEGDEDDDDDE